MTREPQQRRTPHETETETGEHSLTPEGESAREQAPANPSAPVAAVPWPDSLLLGGGEMGKLIHEYDWASTPLGPIENWPQSLRTMVSTIVVSPYPLVVMWGTDLILLYNDAYRPIAGGRHPSSFGQPFRIAFPETWNSVSTLMLRILTTGTPVNIADMPVINERNYFPEETYFNTGFSSIRDESGGNGGIFLSLAESTHRVLAERRIATLSALAAEHAATTVEQACDRSMAALATNTSDVPFVLLYLLDESGATARLAGSVGFEGASAAEESAVWPATVDLTPQRARHVSPLHQAGRGGARGNGRGEAGLATTDAEREGAVRRGAWHAPSAGGGWPLAEVLRRGEAVEVDDLEARFGAGTLPGGPWPEPARRALVLPLAAPTQERLAGFLVLGASPRLPFDDAYRQFFTLAAGQIAAAIANAQAHEEERARVEALAALDRAKTAFFSNVSHEFRTPLTLLLGPVWEALADRAEPLPPGQRERQEIVQRNATRLLKLVNTLLDFSRIEAGRAQARYEPTELAAYTAELASVFRSAIESAGLRLTVDCPPLPAAIGPVYVDRDMWEKVVLNLLSNAFKFTFAGEIAVSLRAMPPRPSGKVAEGEASSSPRPPRDSAFSAFSVPSPSSSGTPSPRRAEARPGGEVQLTVRDSGVGIAPEDLPHIFERFHRVEGVRARTHEGAGIGLALVRDLVRLHGGEVRVESAPGRGTEFVVTLPTGAAHLPAEHVGPAETARALSAVATSAAPFVDEALAWLPEGADGASRDASVAALIEGDARGARGGEGVRAAGAMSESAPGSASTPTASILLVEDNADMRAYLRRLLAGQGWTVETAADGVAALAAAREGQHDLVLADVMLPAMDGFALLRALRTDPALAAAPVVLLSARAGSEAVAEGLEAGADDYLTKPFSARELLASVRAHLALGRLRRQIVETQARERALRTSNQQMEEFMGRASHELRTPLTSLKANVELLALRLAAAENAASADAAPAAAPSREVELVARTERQVRRLSRLVGDLVDDARLQSGQIDLHLERVNLAQVVRETVEEQRTTHPQRSISLELPSEPEDVVVMADADRTGQVLTNYLTNALTYSDERQPVAVSLRLEPGAEQIQVSVRDQGPGIPIADQARIWERFQRVEGQRHRSGSRVGLGLGLFISKEIVERHGGAVGVESAPGAGSVFWFTLPLPPSQRGT